MDHDFRKLTLPFSLFSTCRHFSCSMPLSLQCFWSAQMSSEGNRDDPAPSVEGMRVQTCQNVTVAPKRLCSHSQRGAPWTPWNRCLFPRGQVCSPYPTFPKSERIQILKFILLLLKIICWPPEDATTLEHEMQGLGFSLSSAGPGIFTNSCNWWIHNSPCSFPLEAVCRVWLPSLLHWLSSFPMAMPTDGHWDTMLSRIYPRVWRNHHAKPTHERWEEDLVLELISMFLKVSFSSGDIKSNKEPPSENWEEPEVWFKD